MSGSELAIYLGKPHLVTLEQVKEAFTVHEASTAEELYQILKRRRGRLLTVLLDLDSACQVNQGWEGRSSTALSRQLIDNIRELAPGVTISGVTGLQPLSALLQGAGCERVFLAATLISELQEFQAEISSSSSRA